MVKKTQRHLDLSKSDPELLTGADEVALAVHELALAGRQLHESLAQLAEAIVYLAETESAAFSDADDAPADS